MKSSQLGIRRERKAALGITLALGAILVAWFGLRPSDKAWRDDPTIQRHRNLSRIGSALNRYREDHNARLPDRLSRLVPQYVEPSHTGWFVWPPTVLSPTNSNPLPTDQISRLIDVEGAFVYVGEGGVPVNLLAYDRPSLWPRDQSGTMVVTLTTNYTSLLRSVEDFTNRLAQVSMDGKR